MAPLNELQRLADVMNQLRSPGGCPWDAEQTHESLLKYLLEESYEFIEAVESGNSDSMKEELGDLLLQVFFHARISEENNENPFNVNDVARGVADKLISRHPHVFGNSPVSSSKEVISKWEELKKIEKNRKSAVDGVPLGQPALQLSAKLVQRALENRAELPSESIGFISEKEITFDLLGRALLALATIAIKNDLDPEAALRKVSLEYAETLRNFKH